jgi:predicted transcriptional regulator
MVSFRPWHIISGVAFGKRLSAIPEVIRMLEDDQLVLQITAEIVSAFAPNLRIDDAIKALGRVHDEVQRLAHGIRPTYDCEPAVPISESVHEDYIICLEDGKKFKSLKRHLTTIYRMTPAEYRKKWSLPSNYPMVASSYSQTRSKMAKDIGLGLSNKKPAKKSSR